MELASKSFNMSDDEEDLELLRMAALQTLKKPSCTSVMSHVLPPPSLHNIMRASPQNKMRRGFYAAPVRGTRNAQFMNRSRNTNLISIPTVQPKDPPLLSSSGYKEPQSAPKLILPQDRYCNKAQEQMKVKATNKFNRYDNSDDSESEEDSESDPSDSEGKLEKSNSLEELMQELEYEISGEKPRRPKERPRKRKMHRLNSENDTSMSEAETKIDVSVEEEVSREVNKTPEEPQIITTDIEEAPVKPVIQEVFLAAVDISRKYSVKRRSHSPDYKKRSPVNGHRRHPKSFHQNHRNDFNPPYVEIQQNYPMPFIYTPSLPIGKPYMPLNPYPPQLPPHPNFIPHRPLSPLNLNTEVLSTITMAPLSPRSAAFVLQNREIVERRKKSPRRSYSRSPSPRFRRSLSPRSPSPRRYSPKRASPARRVVRSSPARRISPTRILRACSVERKASPKSRKSSPNNKSSVKERLGMRNHKLEETKKRSITPERKFVATEEPEQHSSDLVLEARKRKFEEQEIVAKEGIIFLKPKMDEAGETREEVLEEENKIEEQDDDLLDLDTGETIVDGLFSDDESDDENEGRFKLSSTNKRTATVLPFTQLINGPIRNIKNRPLEETCRDHNRRLRGERTIRDRRRDGRRKRLASPGVSANGSKSRKHHDEDKRTVIKKRVSYKGERKGDHGRVTSPIESRKIEIKIHNPAKYERSDTASEKEMAKRKERSGRKVAVAKELKENEVASKEMDPEVVIDEEEKDVARKTEGDLRAQLSRKRAERQHKLPVMEDVQSRLLHNALQGAVFKKAKKSKRREKEAAPKENEVACKWASLKRKIFTHKRRVHLLYSDGGALSDKKDKIPIRLRLGMTGDSDMLVEPKRKKKNKGRSSEQV